LSLNCILIGGTIKRGELGTSDDAGKKLKDELGKKYSTLTKAELEAAKAKAVVSADEPTL
jgi:hypothetical protein